jgi:hypothetical protein
MNGANALGRVSEQHLLDRFNAIKRSCKRLFFDSDRSCSLERRARNLPDTKPWDLQRLPGFVQGFSFGLGHGLPQIALN